MFLYAAAIFCSAFLLFLVQPLIGKYILPWFGGGPGVWTTCLLFFQLLLLGGYAYAHLLASRMRPARQALVHGALLLAALALLPITPAERWRPTGLEPPVLQILLLLAATIGLPYFALSATGPLLQSWFARTHPGRSPYRLYALSNAGSLLALLAYPFVFEPRFTRGQMGWGWSAGLAAFVALGLACAWRLARAGEPAPAAAPAAPTAAETAPTPIDRLLWVALPAVASLLLVATTNKLCLDVAAIPFLWVLPLALYLLSFIVCFDHPRWYHRGFFCGFFALMCCIDLRFFGRQTAPLPQQVLALGATLWAACMLCHGELHRLRPAASRLTGYYLAIAAGGALGSAFVSLLAPVLFVDFRELQLGLVLLAYLVGVICWFQRSATMVFSLAYGMAVYAFTLPLLRAEGGDTPADWFVSVGREYGRLVTEDWGLLLAGAALLGLVLRDRRRSGGAWRPHQIALPVLLVALLAAVFVRHAQQEHEHVFAAERNFYGAYKVTLFDSTPDPTTHFLVLANGGITHGQQFRGGIQMRWPTTYYSETSGLGRAIAVLPPGPRYIGAIGLGSGTLAAYGRPGDRIRFYEINPAIVGVASRTFTYLRNTRATVNIALGDARLVMERELRNGPSQQFDLLVLDAFSGDAIPIHLLTREAMALYRRQLRTGGIIAVHISNRHLDLRPAVEGLAREAGFHAVSITDHVDPKHWWLNDTQWMLLTTDAALLAREEIGPVASPPLDADTPPVVWTDDYASLFPAVR